MRNELLTLIQQEFPICQRPFAKLAQTLGCKESDVLGLYRQLKEEKIIRQTSGIFDTKSLGYASSLVAFEVEDIEQAADFVNTHPGVSHNYERDHDFNLWFTIAVEPDSRLGLEKTVELMAQKSGAKNYLILPTKKMFKIKVQLDMTGKKEKKERIEDKRRIRFELDEKDKELIKALQEDIEATEEPFASVVERMRIDYEELQNLAQRLRDGGYMRRFASILYHRRAGFRANAMVVWEVDEQRAEEIGKEVASFRAVSHCYLRPTYPNWPYSLFSMIHGRSKEEVEAVVQEIASSIEPKSYRYLYSTKEFKKRRIKYFSDQFKEWERKYA